MAEIEVEIDPSAVPAVGLTNQATATGNDNDGNPVTDQTVPTMPGWKE